MKRIKMLAAVGFVGLVAIAGCKKAEEKKETPAEATKPAEGAPKAEEAPKAAEPAAVAPAAVAPAAADPAAAAPAAPLPAGAISDAELSAAVDQVFGAIEKIADAAAANPDDCAKAAAAIKKVADENKATFVKAKEMEAKDPSVKDRADKLMTGKMDKLQAVMAKMMPVSMKCEKDPAFAEAMASMQM